jgi:hypothetical protein
MNPNRPLRLVSTDFDGTIHADFSHGPVPVVLQERLKALQTSGVLWVINTGRDLASLMESIGRSRMQVIPDYVVAVEREIYRHVGGHFEPLQPWNDRCHSDHAAIYATHAPELKQLARVLEERYDATFYADGWSPLCVIARSNSQMDAIQAELEVFSESVPELVSVRNDVYSRLSHRDYSKGTALAEIQRLTGRTAGETFAAGDHLNDLPMLQPKFARWLATPSNGLPTVKAQVASHGGYIAAQSCGDGVFEALETLFPRGS